MTKKLCFCKVKWYDEYSDKTCENELYAFGYDMANICARIEDTFEYIDSINIKLIDSTDGLSPDLFFVDGLDEKAKRIINEANCY